MIGRSSWQWLNIHPLSLFILGSHSLQNSCTTTFISYPGGHTSELTLALILGSSGCLMGVDVNPPEGWKQSAHVVDVDVHSMWLLWPVHF